MMQTPDKKLIRRDFSRAAERYEREADLQRAVREELLSLARRDLASGGRVLDIGSGPGSLANRIGGSAATLYQLDIAFAMCHHARRYAPAINADMENLPCGQNVFDGVISSLAFQWATDLPVLFAEIHRILKTTGWLRFSTFGPGTLRELRAAFPETAGGSHIASFPHRSVVAEMLVQTGFEQVTVASETESRHYPDVRALMKKLKAVGGGNKLAGRRNYLGKSMLYHLEETYRRMSSNPYISATWEVYYVSAWKPSA